MYAKNPDLLQTQIAQFRDQGNDTKANELAGYLGKITAKEELGRQKELAQLGLLGAQTEAQRAQAKKYATEIEQGKINVTSISDGLGGGTIIYADKTGKEVNRIVVTPEIVNKAGAKPGTTPKGETPDPATFDPKVKAATTSSVAQPVGAASSMPTIDTPTAAPIDAAPVAPARVANVPALDPQTRIYYAARDPVLVAIQQAAAADPQRVATDPTFFQQLTKARNDQIAMLRNKYGNMVSFEGL